MEPWHDLPHLGAGFQVALVGSDQWPVWREVRRRALTESPGCFGATLAEWSGEGDTEARWRARLEGAPANAVAYLGRELIGQASLANSGTPGGYELISVWVDPAVRGVGVLEGLLATLGGSLRARSVVLNVKRDNTRAVAAYRRVGFAYGGQNPEDASEDTWHMRPESRLWLARTPSVEDLG